MKTALFALLLLSVSSAWSQVKVIRSSIYFDTDKHNLRKDSRKALDRLADSISGLEVTRIITKGNTDSEGDSLYNVRLSNDRTLAVTNYLAGKQLDRKLFTTEYYGENMPVTVNDTEDGKQKNRRVDILVFYKVKPPVVTKPAPLPPEPPKVAAVTEDPCKGDTTITLAKGTQVTFNRCEFLERYSCLDLAEITTTGEVRTAGLTTMENSSGFLASGGMFSLMPKPGCGSSAGNCFKTPVIVRMPVPPSADGRTDFNMYDLNPAVTWTATKKKPDIVTIAGVKYFQFEMDCPGRKNIDRKIKGTGLGRTTLRVPRRYRIVEAVIYSEAPFSVYTFSPRKRKYLIKKRQVPCFVNYSNVDITVTDKKGDTLVLVSECTLDQYTKRYWCSKCGKMDEIETRKLGIFPMKKRGLYRRYRFKKEEFMHKGTGAPANTGTGEE